MKNSALVVILVWFTSIIEVTHGACKCGQQDSMDVAPALDCLVGQDEGIRDDVPINEAVCAKYDFFKDGITQETFCGFRQERTIIHDICSDDGFCLIQNPNFQIQQCHEGQTYCNYLISCPPTEFGIRLPVLLCDSLDLPSENPSLGVCHDKATVFSSGLTNGRQEVCGTQQDCFPLLFSFGDIEIKYASSLCCHNHGFRFVSYCTSQIPFSAFQTETTLSKGNPELVELETRLPPHEELIGAESMTLSINASLSFGREGLTVLFPSESKERKKCYEKISVLEVYDFMRGTLQRYSSSSKLTVHGHGVLKVGKSIAQYLFLRIPMDLVPSPDVVDYIRRIVHQQANLASTKLYKDTDVKLTIPKVPSVVPPPGIKPPPPPLLVQLQCEKSSFITPIENEGKDSFPQPVESVTSINGPDGNKSPDYGGIDVQAEYGDNPFVVGLSQESSSPTYDSIQVAPIDQSDDSRIE